MSQPFRVVDETQQRVDLARRTELKYPLHHLEVHALRSVLEASCHRINHRQPMTYTIGDEEVKPASTAPTPISTVRSLYFDDPKLSSGYANIDGLGKRNKLRLRWYDSPLPTKTAYLEIKWRENSITGKQRLRLEFSRPLQEMRYQELVEGLREVAPIHFQKMLDRYFDPTLIVEYQREHFASTDGSLRLTIDYDLRFYDQTGKLRPRLQFGVAKPRFVVLEGKSSPANACELQGLLHPLSLRIGRCSKYVHGLQAVGLIHALRC